MDDISAENVLRALGGRLRWEWTLRSSMYKARHGDYEYRVYPPEISGDVMWMLTAWDMTWPVGLFIMGGPFPNHNVPCLTLDEAKEVSEYHAVHGHMPDGVAARKIEYDAAKQKRWRRETHDENRREKLRLASTPRKKRRQ